MSWKWKSLQRKLGVVDGWLFAISIRNTLIIYIFSKGKPKGSREKNAKKT